MKKFAYPQIAARLFGPPLAIEPRRLKAILDAIGPRVVLGMEDQEADGAQRPKPPSAAAMLAKRMAFLGPAQVVPVHDGLAEYCRTPGGVAVISVNGPLAQRYDWIAALCGFSSYDTLNLLLDAALADPLTKAILYDVDSPGGECAGMFDAADNILAARTAKPIWAVANSCACSAAYALAGSAERLFAPRMAYVGSIGVVSVHVDVSGEDEQLGLKYTAIYSGRHKIDGWEHAPLSDQARDLMQSDFDDARRLFAELVGRQGRIDQQGALDTEADVYRDQGAVDAGLADEVGSFEQALQQLEELAAGRPAKLGGLFAVTTTQGATMSNPKAGKPPAATTETQPDPAQSAPENPTPTTPAPAQADPAAAAAAAQAAAQTQAVAAAEAHALQVTELCALAGLPHLATTYLRAKTPIDAVRGDLLKKKAAAADAAPTDASNSGKAATPGAVIDTAAIYAARNKRPA